MRQAPRIIKDLFIDGKFVKSAKRQTFDVINPADETVLATIQRGSNEDIDLAIKAAQNAFNNGPWSRMSASERAQIMIRFADLVEKNADELAIL